MYRELVISIIIVIVIVSLDYKTQEYTKFTVDDTTQSLIQLEDKIKGDQINEEEVTNEVNKIYQQWLDYHKKLAFYLEHDELEKIETNFVACKSFIESNEYNLALSELDKTVFVLEHISDKYSFSLLNIF